MSRILNDADFEALRLYDEDSPEHQIVAKELKKIFTRLFQNTEVNPDDFYFTVFDDSSPNAFFMRKANTKDKKLNIIAVSSGLINMCNNEAELAGIIGHECGHYLWNQLLGGNNTIFQEHTADLRAVDLMMNGGYNPLHHLEANSRLFSTYGVRYSDVDLGVHGNGLARIEDLKAYLTKISNEKGYFPEIKDEKDTDYEVFQTAFNRARQNSPYRTYIENILYQNLSTTDVTSKNLPEVLNLLADELRKKTITPDYHARFSQLANILNKTNERIDLLDGEYGNLYAHQTPKLTKACQNFTNATYETLAPLVPSTWHSGMETLRSTLNNLPVYFKLAPYGVFEKQIENINNFINYKTPEEALASAKEMKKLEKTALYRFDYPQWNALGKENIGRKFPWIELLDYSSSLTSTEDQEALDYAVVSLCPNTFSLNRYPRNLPNTSNFFSIRNSEFDRNDYFLNEDGTVLSFGDEAREKYAQLSAREWEEKEQKDEIDRTNYFKSRKDNFLKELDIFSKLAEFASETDETKKAQFAKEFFEMNEYRIPANPSLRPKSYSPLYIPYEGFDELSQKILSSKANSYFLADNDILANGLTYHIFSELSRLSYDNYCKHSKDQSIDHRVRQCLRQEFETNVINSRFDMGFNLIARNKVFKAAEALLPYAENDENRSRCLSFMQDLSELRYSCPAPAYYVSEKDQKYLTHTLEEKYQEDSRIMKLRTLHRCLDHLPINYRPSLILEHYHEEFNHGTVSPAINKVAHHLGIKNPYSTTQIFDTIDEKFAPALGSAPFDRNIHPSYWNYDIDKVWDNLGLAITAHALKSDKDFNLLRTLRHIRYCNTNIIKSDFADLLAQKVQNLDKFKTLSLDDKIEVYEILEEKDLFSGKISNQKQYFHAITEELINYPDKQVAVEYTEKILSNRYIKLDYFGNKQDRRQNDLFFGDEKDRLIQFYAAEKARDIGLDDGSPEYFEKAQKLADTIDCDIVDYSTYNSTYYKPKFSADTLQNILEAISTNTSSQEAVAQMFTERATVKVSGNDAEKYDMRARFVQAAFSELANSPKKAKATINFLSHKATPENLNNYKKDLGIYNFASREIQVSGKYYRLKDTLVEFAHNGFWHANLEARAYLMTSLLKSYSSDDEDVLNLIMDMNFQKDSPYYKEADRVVRTVFKHLKPYERNLILGALVASNQKDTGQNDMNGEKIGEGLKMFFENKGPAFVKFGQLLSYMPTIDSDIRKPLATLRDKANIPNRSDLFELMHETIPESELKKVSHVGKILGAGSFFVSVQIKYNNKDCVIAVMRPHTKELVKSGMEMINSTVKDLAQQNSTYKPMMNIARQAYLSAINETNIEKDYFKSERAQNIYNGIEIKTPAGVFQPEVAQWEAFGRGKDGLGYKIMNMAEGLPLTSNKISVQDKHDMAVAYTTLELLNLLGGNPWDTDRHQGQQNFAEVAGEGNFKKFIIGIFDTGAQMEQAPKLKDKVLLGEMLYGMSRAARLNKNIADYMIEKVKSIDKSGDRLNFNTLYIDDVQRGLTALSDIMTYQKEIKSPDGKIIQTEKSLTAEDMANVVTAILDSGLVDKKINTAIKTKAMLNKMRFLRQGWYDSLLEGISKKSSNITISYNRQCKKRVALLPCNKSKEELDKLHEDKSSRIKLGVDTRHLTLKTQDKENY